MIDEFQPRPPLGFAAYKAVFLAQALARCLNLACDGVFEAPELLRDGLQCQSCVGPCGANSGRLLEPGDHYLHLVVVLSVPLLHLQNQQLK